MATQKDILEKVLRELTHIKKHMPNGELKALVEDVKEMKDNMSDLKYTLLNPDDGVIVRTNKNSEFRKEMQANEKDFQLHMQELESLKNWKDGVNKALWIVFALIAGIIVKLVFGIELPK